MSQQEIGIHILRLGLAAVFLWFGFSQIFDSLNWVSWVPEWAVNVLHIPPAMIVLLNGSFEIIAGGLLALNVFTRWAALLLTLHMALLVVEIGPNEIGVRDLGILAGVMALLFLTPKKEETATEN